jgi:hypothetical protein
MDLASSVIVSRAAVPRHHHVHHDHRADQTIAPTMWKNISRSRSFTAPLPPTSPGGDSRLVPEWPRSEYIR